MIDEFVLILFPVVFTVIFVLIARLASFLKHFAVKTRCICREMDHADSYEDYRKWRGELRCHYLMLIPFVNRKNVMCVYRRIFHKGDLANKKERRDSLAPLLLPSILGVCVCTICVCGMTWAWYSASVRAPAQKMTGAYYEVHVVSVKAETSGQEITPEGGGYKLEGKISYTVTLSAEGTVQKCGGYCLIECGGTKLYTQTFKSNDEIIVKLTPPVAGTYTFTGVWGSLPSIAGNNYLCDITSVMQSGISTPGTSPNTGDTVPPSSNSTIDSSCIESDENSRIPPQDYAISETTVPEETTLPVTGVPDEPVIEPDISDSTDSSSIQSPIEHSETDMPDRSEAQAGSSADSLGETEQVNY